MQPIKLRPFAGRRRLLAGLTAGSILWLSACGGDSATTGRSARRQARPEGPCRLLKPAEVESAIGAETGPGNLHQGTPPVSVIGMQHCVFASRSAGGPAPTVYVGITSAFSRQVFDKYKNSAGAGVEPVTLGTEAVYKEFGPTSSLVVLDGDKVVSTSAHFVRKDAKQLLEALAKKALARA